MTLSVWLYLRADVAQLYTRLLQRKRSESIDLLPITVYRSSPPGNKVFISSVWNVLVFFEPTSHWVQCHLCALRAEAVWRFIESNPKPVSKCGGDKYWPLTSFSRYGFQRLLYKRNRPCVLYFLYSIGPTYGWSTSVIRNDRSLFGGSHHYSILYSTAFGFIWIWSFNWIDFIFVLF